MILMVDDEKDRILAWKIHLDACPELAPVRPIVHISDTDLALKELTRPDLDLHLAIFDVIMPTPRSVSGSNTSFGLRTGSYLHRVFHEIHPDVPAILLTNASDPGLRKDFHDPERGRWFALKSEVGGKELVGLVRKILKL